MTKALLEESVGHFLTVYRDFRGSVDANTHLAAGYLENFN
jgi:hypothetical protein